MSNEEEDLPTAGVEAILQVVIETGENEDDVFDTRIIKDSKDYIRKNCHYDEMVIVDELVRRKYVEKLVLNQEPLAWLCPQGGEIFKKFIQKDREDKQLLHCPRCGKLKSKIDAQPEIDHHIPLISQEKLSKEVQSSEEE